jgi:hypothetical protein
MEFLQLFHSPDPLPIPKGPNSHLAHSPAQRYGPSEAPSNPRSDLRFARGLPAEALDSAPQLRFARG